MTDAFPWVPDADGQRCVKHKQRFPKTGVCSDCTATKERPAIAAPKAKIPRAPRGCMSSLQLEHWFVELGKAAAADAAAIAAAFPLQLPTASSSILVVDATAPATRIRDFHDESAIAKHREIAIKAMRSATLLALRREDDHIVAERDAEIAARSRGASH